VNLVADHFGQFGVVTMCSTTKFTVPFLLFSMCESITLVYSVFTLIFAVSLYNTVHWEHPLQLQSLQKY